MTGATLLKVPYRPQFGVGASYRWNDCSLACASSVIEFATGIPIRVDTLARESSLVKSDSGLGLLTACRTCAPGLTWACR